MADAQTSLGAVVVGVGKAGKVRIRDILQSTSAHPQLKRLKLQGFVSRRELQLEGVEQCTLEEALHNPSVQIVLICLENDQHHLTAQKALEAGKHVLVEFPLALSANQAKELQDYASKKGLVCYEEDISLLSDQYVHVKDLLQTKAALVEGEVWLEGRLNGWIENHEQAGSAFHSSISQIHRLLNYFGDVKPVDAKIVRGKKTLESVGTVKTPDGGIIQIRIQREDLDKPKRATGFRFNFADGSIIDSQKLIIPQQNSNPAKPGLFLQDLIQFVEVVEGERDGTSLSRVTLASLQIADTLYELAKNNSQSVL